MSKIQLGRQKGNVRICKNLLRCTTQIFTNSSSLHCGLSSTSLRVALLRSDRISRNLAKAAEICIQKSITLLGGKGSNLQMAPKIFRF